MTFFRVPRPPGRLRTFVAAVSLALLIGLPFLPGNGHPSALAAPGSALNPGVDAPALEAAALSLDRGAGPADHRAWSCPGALGTASVRCTSLPAAEVPAANGAPGWLTEGLAPAPAVGLLAYSSDDNEVIYLGPSPSGSGNGQVAVTWAYSGGVWTDLNLSVAPPSFFLGWANSSVMTADPAYDGILYFGADGLSSHSETWIFQAGGWTQLYPTSSPPLTEGPAMSFDPDLNATVLFGGLNYVDCPSSGDYLCNETWSFSGGSWTNLSASLAEAPTPRFASSLVYDAASRQFLLFGGIGDTPHGYAALNDTWAFNGSAWTQLTPATSPSPMGGGLLTYDGADGYVLLAGGWNTSCDWELCVNRSWTFANGTWTRLSASGGPSTGGAWAIADDVDASDVVVFGGRSLSDTITPGDTWTYSGGHWTNRSSTVPPPSRSDGSMAYDAADGYVVLFGGETYTTGENSYFLGDTWTYAGGVWTNLTGKLSKAPSPRAGAALAYDASDGYLLLFGGNGEACKGGTNPSFPVCNDTWEFVGGSWTKLSPSVSPPARTAAAMTYDAYDGYVLLFGGTNEYGLNDTWTFHAGVWRNLTGRLTTSPTSEGGLAMTYDAADQYVLLFGSPLAARPWIDNTTWAFRAGTWTNLTATLSGAPPATADASFAFDPALNETVLFGGCTVGDCSAVSDSTWVFSHAAWSEVFPSVSPSARDGAPMAYDAADGYLVLFGGRNGGPPYDDAWIWTNTSAPKLAVSSFSIAPTPIDLGQNTTLSVTTVPAPTGLNYSYFGLPSGCASLNRSSITCTPNATGTFTVAVTVQDPAGDRASARGTLVVNTPPGISRVSATPNPVALDRLVVIDVNASGGTGPLAYAYAGLPPGCASQTVPALPCHPTAAGNYSIVVTVTDARGGSASGGTALTVGAVGAGSAPSITAFGAAPASIVLGNSTTIATSVAAGASSDAFRYAGLPAGCVSANVTSLNCTPTAAGTFTLSVTVTSPSGSNTSVSSGLTVYPAGGGTAAAISAFAASPGSVALGETTVLAVLASGGVGWLAYAFLDLPSGCLSANVSSLACAPTEVGLFQVYVVVRDAVGASVSVPTPLRVTAPTTASRPAIAEFLARPGTLPLGQSLLLVVIASGVAPLGYAYRGLPVGCASVDAATLNCTPGATGAFNVSVIVTDGVGQNVSAWTPVNVVPAPSGRGPGTSGGAPGGVGPDALIVAALLLGLVVAVPIVAWIDRRHRWRSEGEELLRAIGEDPDPVPEAREG